MTEDNYKIIKCLSLRQPYADLLVEGKKIIELRKWNTKFRGIFLVHASKRSFTGNYNASRLGCIVGKVELWNVQKYENVHQWNMDKKFHLAGDDFQTSTYGFMLRNPVKFDKPIPFSGSLNFFNVLFDEENWSAKQFIGQQKIC